MVWLRAGSVAVPRHLTRTIRHISKCVPLLKKYQHTIHLNSHWMHTRANGTPVRLFRVKWIPQFITVYCTAIAQVLLVYTNTYTAHILINGSCRHHWNWRLPFWLRLYQWVLGVLWFSKSLVLFDFWFKTNVQHFWLCYCYTLMPRQLSFTFSMRCTMAPLLAHISFAVQIKLDFRV